MNITISANWFYGYLAHDIGQYKYDAEKRSSEFHWRGQVHASSWCACNELRNELYKLQGYQSEEKQRVFAGTFGGENVVGVKWGAEVGRICEIPAPEELKPLEKLIRETLDVLGGFDDLMLPTPKLYFAVDVGDE